MLIVSPGTSSSTYYSAPSSALYVLSADSTPVTPTLSSVYFSDTGAQLYVIFSSDTNQAGYSSSFTCNKLFNFKRASAVSRSARDHLEQPVTLQC